MIITCRHESICELDTEHLLRRRPHLPQLISAGRATVGERATPTRLFSPHHVNLIFIS
jgi:hypothetical protein